MVVYAFIVGMYLRTTHRKNKDGSTVTYYHLAHNYRHPETKNSIPKVIHNFGRSDQCDREELVRLCKSIAKVCGVEVTDPMDSGQENKEAGLPKETMQIETKEYGTVLVIEALWDRLGIGDAIKRICSAKGCKAPYERALLAMTANRLCRPESKLGVWDRWVRDDVYMPECKGLKLHQMYKAMDVLQSNSLNSHVSFLS